MPKPHQSRVLAMVARQSGELTVVGLAAGFLASLALTGLLSTLLFEVRSTDVGTAGAAALVLAAAALLASYLPVRRASCIDPISALRME